MKRIATMIACACAPSMVSGTAMEPWFPEKSVELQARADYLFQVYDTVQSSGGDFSYRARDSFLGLSVLGSLEGYGAEAEVVLSDTKHHSFYPDCLKLTGRTQIFNDSVGDSFSLMAGVSLIVPTTAGLDDISSFHHGHFEAEAHLAIGRENICYDQWTSRYWALAALGCATDEGSPWFRLDGDYESKWGDVLSYRAFLHSLWGLGGNPIRRHDFHGYGSIAHRSVDLGVGLGYLTDCGSTLSFDYAYRVYAHNMPKNVNLFTLNLLYPFGL